MHDEAQGSGVHREERRQRLRPWGKLEFFQVQEERAQNLGRSNINHWISR
jgi:hypothetical protein